jgi:hypothetical protein
VKPDTSFSLIEIRQVGSHSTHALTHPSWHAALQLAELLEFLICLGGLSKHAQCDR